jgi:hypothetical protein
MPRTLVTVLVTMPRTLVTVPVTMPRTHAISSTILVDLSLVVGPYHE